MFSKNIINKIEELIYQFDDQKSFEILVDHIQNNQLSLIEVETAKRKVKSVIDQLEEQSKNLSREIIEQNHKITSYKKYINKALG